MASVTLAKGEGTATLQSEFSLRLTEFQDSFQKDPWSPDTSKKAERAYFAILPYVALLRCLGRDAGLIRLAWNSFFTTYADAKQVAAHCPKNDDSRIWLSAKLSVISGLLANILSLSPGTVSSDRYSPICEKMFSPFRDS